MGTAASSSRHPAYIPQLTKSEMDQLLAATHYTKEEVNQLHGQFIAEVPSGVIPRSQFAIYALILGVTDPIMADLLFNAFDLNGDGMISCQEFIRSMSTMTRGTNDEKIQFAFRMYDTERVGYLTREGVHFYLTSIGKLVPLKSYPTHAGGPASSGGLVTSPGVAVDRMFANVPEGGRMGFAHFKEYCLTNDFVMAGLALR